MAYNQGGIGSSESKRVGKERIKFQIYPLGRYIQLCGSLVRFLEIEVGSDETVIHHEDGVNHFTGTCHPHFMSYIKFKLKTTDKLDKMVDLVVADQRDKTYTAENGGKISFTFEHTLSRISFRAQLGAGDFDGMDGTNSFVYITHMWIVGKSHATAGSNLSLIDPASPVNANSKFYTSAKWSELHWNYEADATIAQADFSLDKMLNLESPGIDISTPAAGHDARTQGIRITKASQGAAEKAVPLFKDKEYLYLIPVGEKSGTDLTQNKGCAKGDIKIGFHYDIVSKDATNAGKFIASHGEAFIELPAGHMKRKESYLYTLKINLHKIEISDATVTPWEDIKTEATVE